MEVGSTVSWQGAKKSVTSCNYDVSSCEWTLRLVRSIMVSPSSCPSESKTTDCVLGHLMVEYWLQFLSETVVLSSGRALAGMPFPYADGCLWTLMKASQFRPGVDVAAFVSHLRLPCCLQELGILVG